MSPPTADAAHNFIDHSPKPASGIPTEKIARKKFVDALVIAVIQSFCDKNDPPIRRGTLLGSTGVGHGPAIRKLYQPAIKKRLAKDGGTIPKLTPGSFTLASLKTVGDVCDLVNAALIPKEDE